ncbi:MAG: ABC transporter ATP-binding protein [Nitrospira sp.]|nr:ABC transporter ATP-binding protein [Nitrospira sp.]MDD9860494.1 ABC transporter ATP-binding protein [Nitrospira sp.]
MNYFSRLLPFLRPYLIHMIFASLLIAGVAILNLMLLKLAGTLWDLVAVQRDARRMTQTITLFLTIAVLQSIMAMGQSYLTTRLSQLIIADFRTHLFRHVQTLSLSFFAKRRTGEILSRLMNDVGVIQKLATDTPIDSAKQIVTLVGGIAFLLVMNWKLCLLIVSLIPVLVLVARLFGKRLQTLSVHIQDHTASLSTLIEEVVSGIRVVKSFVGNDREERRFGAALQTLVDDTLRRATIMSVFVPTITLLTFAMAGVVFWYGGVQVIDGAMTPGDLFAFVLFAGILIGPFGSIARVVSQMKEGQGALQRVFELLDTAPEITDSPNAYAMGKMQGAIKFSHVSFAYEPQRPVLSDLSFEVHPGEMVAIVGPTGSGKSTIVNLLHRFYDPVEGCVTIDNQDLRKVQMASLYRQIAFVPQETVLFGDTILENIRYGREDASEQDVIAASQAANAHDFIAGLPDGYATLVGEKGVNFSGGQRQRLAIARAVLKNPRLLILDEATSSLDSESERLVQQALQRLMAGRTTVVIAHRLTTIQEADRIVVLNKGRIVAEGTHTTLMQQDGLYRYLYTLLMAELETETPASPLTDG